MPMPVPSSSKPLSTCDWYKGYSMVYAIIFMPTQMSWLKRYKVIGKSNELTQPQNIKLDGVDTLIPLNLPTFIVGPKGIGKSTLISTILNGAADKNVYERIFYVYADHVDSTIAEACKALLIRIPLPQSPQLLAEYFSIKTRFMSYTKLRDALMHKGYGKDEKWKSMSLDDLMGTYTDNVIDELIRQHNGKVKDILNAIASFIKTYSKPFELGDDGKVRVSGLDDKQYDLVVIDDVGVAASYLFPTSVNKSPLYSYLTICRHIMTGFIIAGQDTMQLPRYARKEINTWVFFKVIPEDLDNITVKVSTREQIRRYGKALAKHQFIVYNGVLDRVQVMEL